MLIPSDNVHLLIGTEEQCEHGPSPVTIPAGGYLTPHLQLTHQQGEVYLSKKVMRAGDIVEPVSSRQLILKGSISLVIALLGALLESCCFGSDSVSSFEIYSEC